MTSSQELKIAITIIQNWGINMVFLSLLWGMIGYIIHVLMMWRLTGGKEAALLRMFVPTVIVALLSALLPALLAYYYEPLYDALRIYNSVIGQPSLNFVGRLLNVLFFDNAVKVLLGMIPWTLAGIFGYTLIGFIGRFAWSY